MLQTRKVKRIVHIVSLCLLILGGLNWGLVGNGHSDMIDWLFDRGSLAARAAYMAMGLAALYQLLPLMDAVIGDKAPDRAADDQSD